MNTTCSRLSAACGTGLPRICKRCQRRPAVFDRRGPTCRLPVAPRDHLCAGSAAAAVAAAVELWVLLAQGQAHHIVAAQGLGRAAQGVTHRPAWSSDTLTWCTAHCVGWT